MLAKQGSDYSQAGRFEEARRAYEAAYARRPDVKLVFNLARVLHKSGRLAEAVTYYQQYLNEGAEGSAEYRLKAEHRLEEARREQGLPAGPLAATGSVPVEPEQRVPVYRKWWLWTAVGVAVAGVAVGVGLGLATRRPDVTGYTEVRPFGS